MPLLSEKRRKELREKAQKRTKRQLRKVTGQANRQIRRIETGADRRSAGVRRSYARGAEQVGNVSTAGLKGRYLNEVEREITATQAGLARVAPHHVNKVQARAAGRVRDIRSGMREARESTQESNLSALIDAARARVADREEAGIEQQEARVENRQDAFKAASSLLNEFKDEPPPQTDAQWQTFAATLQARNPDMSPEEVERATAALRARMVTQTPLPPDVAGPTYRDMLPGPRAETRAGLRRYYREQL